MRLPQISITQQFAKIDITSKAGRQQIRQQDADMEIRQPRGKLEIKPRNVKVEIDSYPSRYDRGYKNMADFRRANIQLAEEAVRDRIAKYTSQGDRLMRIQNKGNALQDVIRENTTPAEKKVGLKWIRGPKFNVLPPDLKINFTAAKAEINVKINKPLIKYERGGVDIRMIQYGKVEFDWKGHSVDQMV